MYEKFLIKIKSELNPEILDKYPDASDFEKCVILLRAHKYNYGQISSKLGSPSKKAIRAALLKWTPELIEEDCNRGKLAPKERASKEEFILINLIRKFPDIKSYNMRKFIYNEDWKFITVEGRLYYLSSEEDYKEAWAYKDWDFVCQTQILNIVKECTKNLNLN